MRAVAAAVLIAVAVGATAAAWGALRNLFADERDSPTSTYLLFGVPWLAVAVLAIAGAVVLLRRR